MLSNLSPSFSCYCMCIALTSTPSSPKNVTYVNTEPIAQKTRIIQNVIIEMHFLMCLFRSISTLIYIVFNGLMVVLNVGPKQIQGSSC